MVYFIFDIETVLDRELFDMTATDRDKEKLDNGDFLNQVFHKPISFAFMAFSESKLFAFKSFVGSEEKIVETFWEKVGKVIEKNPIFVTFNGKGFDFPVMLIRGIKISRENVLSIIRYYLDDSDKWEKDRPNYNYKFSKYHIDLMEAFSVKTSLDKLCSLYGIPVKTESHGKEVENLYSNGELKKIAKYCAEDVLATARLFNLFSTAKQGISFPFLKDTPEADIEILT